MRMTNTEIQALNLIEKMADELKQALKSSNISKYCIVGIQTGGVWVARELNRLLGDEAPMGELNISFYRDDFTRIGLQPTVTPTNLPFATEDAHIILVDDILMTGRTIRAALNELFDFGRPASVTLAVLADIGQRELPISANIIGQSFSLAPNERLKLEGPAPLLLKRKTQDA
ncbi:bifunctional pyr operon transcriptional regulator/uracil phosphoribosyltransferase [Oleiphilus sp. HI0071]|nr:bifunctional pyr operon transcriptional regulator/uracil phosphoribosyltransferase [Oleiphilus sp. HI0065]KZY82339.1 bifunctional pyr operon transcriptional regulator/uracil phosphoribosyltransferase [Oleiphilus sp. HI0071]KZY92073.1 bifunctional pyr operon transcriptional regulator/uracil phosphoribosyltransferase [Oleiphilus sp. HI0073]KZZ11004.1 bifunctional pyr operon transcriptional regulator/uracil phosphoribosyltransferase [Oleiphilus sp. HI0079]KZZ16151.1 bifunctional pyr operon tran